ncbi:MAG: hypothetical protein A3J06_03230 [Candidatus Moranbacteria bacterium RIFCSPLOWO2_02_FULL_48_19]|nr:MAG: hypothetical protein A3J06_03230 [Candidatus Moranbacteria bacterium RIFCSPLOWO2_02_FULL_48_19]
MAQCAYMLAIGMILVLGSGVLMIKLQTDKQHNSSGQAEQILHLGAWDTTHPTSLLSSPLKL